MYLQCFYAKGAITTHSRASISCPFVGLQFGAPCVRWIQQFAALCWYLPRCHHVSRVYIVGYCVVAMDMISEGNLRRLYSWKLLLVNLGLEQYMRITWVLNHYRTKYLKHIIYNSLLRRGPLGSLLDRLFAYSCYQSVLAYRLLVRPRCFSNETISAPSSLQASQGFNPETTATARVCAHILD